jgi:hypothetical protein
MKARSEYDWRLDHADLARRPLVVRCADGFCGAEDCPRCGAALDDDGAMDEDREAQKMTTTVFPSDSKTLQVEVCYLRGTPAFICGANGRISGESMGEIEDGMNEEDAELFRDEGTYLFDAHYEQIGDIGVELEGYWDLTERGFRPLETEAQK